jgi:3-hydroxyisobutyrate dehydrogenase-like beta-hydroxyacid dehydrogenase
MANRTPPTATVGLLHPGEMGAVVGAELFRAGHRVLWASAGRSADTRRRADAAGLVDVGDVTALAAASDWVVSVCPPDAAVALAEALGPFRGRFLDANAVSPATARRVAEVIRSGGGEAVDGGIVGPPPTAAGRTRLYLSGPHAADAAGLFADTLVDARVVGAEIGAASAVKMAYAAWTKGTSALILAIEALARAAGVEAVLHDEWALSQPALADRLGAAARAAHGKGWRWTGEMEEIANTFAAAGLPEGFHRAAAAVYRGVPRPAAGGDAAPATGSAELLDQLIDRVRASSRP